MTKNFERNYGAVFIRLVNSSDMNIRIRRYSTRYNSIFIINENTAIHIKYCTKRLSPWLFVLPNKQLSQIRRTIKHFNHVFLILICGTDGMVILNEEEIKFLVKGSYSKSAWLSISRSRRQQYVIKGSENALHYKMGDPECRKRLWAISKSYKNPAGVSAG